MNVLNGREGLLWSLFSTYAYILKFMKAAMRS
jgi:hypothetical protein